MKELKLKLTDIAGYMPYGLKVYDENEATEGMRTFTVKGIEFDTELFNPQEDENDWLDIGYFKPILRPLSDMWQAITHNGKEITPIFECAKIAEIPHCKSLIIDHKGVHDIMNYMHFDYHKPDGYHFKNAFGGFFYTGRAVNVNNQYQLFDFLNELKIDYRGLIESGLAIDANTLNPNPYE
jgi:hypothetical protein